jgi:hypothetical protein
MTGVVEVLVVFAILALGVFAFVKMIRFMMQSRASTYDTCDECGYDMRATPERCPECGWIRPTRVVPKRLNLGKLVQTVPADEIQPRRPELGEELVVVYETDHYEDAQTLCEHIKARGVICDVRECESIMRQGGSSYRTPYYQLIVWSGDADPVTALVSAATDVANEA